VAGRFVLPVAVGERAAAWCVVDRDQVEVKALAPFDATRGLAELQLDDVEVGAGRWLAVPPRAEAGAPEPEGRAGPADPAELATLLAGAEALGVAEWCVRTAADHAAVRVQFGRPIGQFQAVKHRCADMFVRLETARAAVWDALRCADAGEPGWQVAYGAAAALAPDAAFRGAEDCIQVLGGIGYMWEHDAHIFLKRATATRHLLPAPPAARRDVAAAVAAGERRPLAIELPPEAAGIRVEVQRFVADLRRHDRAEWRRRLADHGYLAPHWPRPWGRAAAGCCPPSSNTARPTSRSGSSDRR
jgi:alkylation response protein AidB-like acyl-CoA dehydrogenase